MTKAKLQTAFALHQAGNLQAAIPLYREILIDNKDNFDALQLLGAALMQADGLQESLTTLEQAKKLNPNHIMLSFNLASLKYKLKMGKEAIEDIAVIEQQITSSPPNLVISTYHLKAKILYDLGEFNQAFDYLQKIKSDIPKQDSEFFNLLGLVEWNRKQYEAARQAFELALIHNPDQAFYLHNLAMALNHLGQSKLALKAIQKAIALEPDNQAIRTYEINIYQSLGMQKKALDLLTEQVNKEPNNPSHRYLLGLHILSLQEPKRAFEGWSLCESRWQVDYMKSQIAYRVYTAEKAPYWIGLEPIKGKRLLLLPEGGYGDCLQMIRYIPFLHKKNVIITMVLNGHNHALQSLLKNIKGISHLVKDHQDAGEQDYFIGMMSLPLAFMNMKRNDNNGKLQDQKYHTKAIELPFDPIINKQWKEHIDQAIGGEANPKIIGVIAKGNPKHAQDYLRSIPLASLMDSLLAHRPPNAHYLILQKDEADDDLSNLPISPYIHNLSPHIKDFVDSAEILRNIDLLITIDSAPAHLAGLLGVPVWLLLQMRADWRWGSVESGIEEGQADKYETPWYPSLHLFRQKNPEQGWVPVFNEIGAALKNLQAPLATP